MDRVKKIDVHDLEHILTNTKDLWEEVRDKTIFITGGTGFFGKWLLYSFKYINEKLSLNASLNVLSRQPDDFLRAHPAFQRPDIHFIKGDISSFTFPETAIDYIIHAATDASASLNMARPILMYDVIVNGTRHVLELARAKNVKAVLHTSSGAVYGQQPPDITHISEDSKASPDIYGKDAAYGEGKRVAEMLSAFYYHHYGVQSKIARCFAFTGPYLPLDAHFAIGNFINDTINDKPIVVNGDGTPYRSYMYASDLVIWLWVILLKGVSCRPYNVGSDEDITVAGLAGQIAKTGKKSTSVRILGVPNENSLPKRYVPCVNRAKNELNLKIKVSLEEAIQKTINFYL